MIGDKQGLGTSKGFLIWDKHPILFIWKFLGDFFLLVVQLSNILLGRVHHRMFA